MDKVKAGFFIILTIGALTYVTYSILNWSIMHIVGVLFLGIVMVGLSIWLYREMYHDDE